MLKLEQLVFATVFALSMKLARKKHEEKQERRKRDGFMTVPWGDSWTCDQLHMVAVIRSLTGCTEGDALNKIEEWIKADLCNRFSGSNSGIPFNRIYQGPPRKANRPSTTRDFILAEAKSLGIL